MTSLLEPCQGSQNLPVASRSENCLACFSNSHIGDRDLIAQAFLESEFLQGRLKTVERVTEQQLRKLLSLTEIETERDCRWYRQFMPREF